MSFGAPYLTLPEFTYHKPKSLKEALELLNKFRDEAKVMAGGVGLIAFMKERLMTPNHVIDIKDIPEMKRIQEPLRLEDRCDSNYVGAGET
jgi:carbon-monoxide dehydrogenase medium subunit